MVFEIKQYELYDNVVIKKFRIPFDNPQKYSKMIFKIECSD